MFYDQQQNKQQQINRYCMLNRMLQAVMKKKKKYNYLRRVTLIIFNIFVVFIQLSKNFKNYYAGKILNLHRFVVLLFRCSV